MQRRIDELTKEYEGFNSQLAALVKQRDTAIEVIRKSDAEMAKSTFGLSPTSQQQRNAAFTLRDTVNQQIEQINRLRSAITLERVELQRNQAEQERWGINAKTVEEAVKSSTKQLATICEQLTEAQNAVGQIQQQIARAQSNLGALDKLRSEQQHLENEYRSVLAAEFAGDVILVSSAEIKKQLESRQRGIDAAEKLAFGAKAFLDTVNERLEAAQNVVADLSEQHQQQQGIVRGLREHLALLNIRNHVLAFASLIDDLARVDSRLASEAKMAYRSGLKVPTLKGWQPVEFLL